MRALACCLTIALLAPRSAHAQKFLYWTQGEAGTVHRADMLGGGSMVISSGTPHPYGVTVDPVGAKVYWTHIVPNAFPDRGRIFRSNLDGGDITVFAERPGLPIKVAVAHTLGKVYWTQGFSSSTGPGRVMRSNLDGTGAETLVTGGSPHDLFLDEVTGRMYWSDYQGRVRRANLDGSAAIDLVQAPSNVLGLAVDLGADRMYWVALQSGSTGRDIRTSRLDGSGQQTLIPNVHAEANGLDVDPDAGMLYWSEAFGIKRSNLNGGGIELVVPRNYEPYGQDVQVVIVPEPTAWAALSVAPAILALRRGRRIG